MTTVPGTEDQDQVTAGDPPQYQHPSQDPEPITAGDPRLPDAPAPEPTRQGAYGWYRCPECGAVTPAEAEPGPDGRQGPCPTCLETMAAAVLAAHEANPAPMPKPLPNAGI